MKECRRTCASSIAWLTNRGYRCSHVLGGWDGQNRIRESPVPLQRRQPPTARGSSRLPTTTMCPSTRRCALKARRPAALLATADNRGRPNYRRYVLSATLPPCARKRIPFLTTRGGSDTPVARNVALVVCIDELMKVSDYEACRQLLVTLAAFRQGQLETGFPTVALVTSFSTLQLAASTRMDRNGSCYRFRCTR